MESITALLKKHNIKGMAHITGGGFIENAPRMLKDTAPLKIVINKGSYPLPDIYKLFVQKGVDLNHMYNVFNMGIGFMLCVDKKDVTKVLSSLKALKEKAYHIGSIEKKTSKENIQLI